MYLSVYTTTYIVYSVLVYVQGNSKAISGSLVDAITYCYFVQNNVAIYNVLMTGVRTIDR